MPGIISRTAQIVAGGKRGGWGEPLEAKFRGEAQISCIDHAGAPSIMSEAILASRRYA
jgi:hypothetical protein